MSDTPKVTVLMPVFNGEKYIRRAIDSILDQTFRNFELLIVNDGSTDNTVEIVKSYSDHRIKLINNEHNLYLTATLNRGIEIARGKYIARMDSDDISLPERFERQVEFLEKCPEVGVLGTAFQIIDEDENRIKTIAYPGDAGFIRWRLCFSCPLAHPTIMMQKSVIQNGGGYGSEILDGREKFSGEDYELWGRLSKFTQISNLQNVLLLYRQHKKSISYAFKAELLENTIRISHKIISTYLQDQVSMDTVRWIWDRKSKTGNQARKASTLIYKLWQKTGLEFQLSAKDRKAIDQDAAERLIGIARSRFWDPISWGIILIAVKMDPSILLKIGKHKLATAFSPEKSVQLEA